MLGDALFEMNAAGAAGRVRWVAQGDANKIDVTNGGQYTYLRVPKGTAGGTATQMQILFSANSANTITATRAVNTPVGAGFFEVPTNSVAGYTLVGGFSVADFQSIYEIRIETVDGTMTIGPVGTKYFAYKPVFDDLQLAQTGGTSTQALFWDGTASWNRTIGSAVIMVGNGEVNMNATGTSGPSGSSTGYIWYRSITSNRMDFTDGGSNTFVRIPQVGGAGTQMQFYFEGDLTANKAYITATASGGYFTASLTDLTGYTIEGAFSVADFQTLKGMRIGPVDNPVTAGVGGGEPHVVCLDNSRIEIYHRGFYRLFEHGNKIVNLEVEKGFARRIWATDLASGKKGLVVFSTDNTRCELDREHTDMAVIAHIEPNASFGGHVVLGFDDDTEVLAQGKHGTFGIRNPKWRRGDVVEGAAGAMTGRLQMVASLEDATPVDAEFKRDVTICFYTANALVCDALQPHVVTFSGDSFNPKNETVALLREEGCTIEGSFDDQGRVTELQLHRGEKASLLARWERSQEKFAEPEMAMPKEVKLFVDGEVFENVTIDENATAVHEGTIDFASGRVFLRIQANGAVSFAWEGSMEDLSLLEGMLAEGRKNTPNDDDLTRLTGMGSGLPSIYEQTVEPHIVWDKGVSRSGVVLKGFRAE